MLVLRRRGLTGETWFPPCLEQGQESGGRTVPFDDREVARDALRRLGARA
jgi:hypothetical protein